MKNSDNIFLIGSMGAGKSSVGKHLAKKLQKKFLDADKEIENCENKTIADIFKINGENYFRQVEESLISKLVLENNIVLALGGGAILSEKTRILLSTHGLVIYLQVSLATQIERLKHATNRPLIFNENLSEKLTALALTRKDFYESIADFTVSTDNKTPTQIADEIEVIQNDDHHD